LNKEILKYKAIWYNRDIVEIDRYFPSSKLCNCCGYKNNDLTLKDRVWTCPNCKTIHNRDLNAAINIKNEGIKLYNFKENITKIGSRTTESTLVDNRIDWLKQEEKQNEV